MRGGGLIRKLLSTARVLADIAKLIFVLASSAVNAWRVAAMVSAMLVSHLIMLTTS